MGKIIGGIVAVIIILVAVVAGVFYFNLDKIIIAAVEKYGSEVTQTDVVLNEVDLDLTSGKGALSGFSVGNPSGFSEPTAVQFNTVAVNVDIPNTNDKLIHITEIRIEQPAITYEVNETTNNLDAIQKNIDTFMKENGMSGGEQKEEASSEEGPKLIIDNIYINGGKVTVKATVLLDQKVEGKLADIHMQDIGKSEGGASPEEVAALLVNEISGSAMAVVTDLGIGKTVGTLLDNAGDLANKVGVGDAAVKAGEISKDAGKGTTEAVKNYGKSLNKLLKD